MIEGQEEVTWPQWLDLARACERAGLEGLFRSDHYLSVADRRERGSLDAWGTICALAAVTDRLRLGTLVSPVTFRHPSVLAKLVATADQIAGPGRIELGIGAGWWEAEHRTYGFEFPPARTRFDLLAEQLELIVRGWTEAEVDFDGEHYRAEGLDVRPKPESRPNLILGGRGRPRSAALAARWADEYNTIFATAEQCRARRQAVLDACERIGRERPMRFSLMTGVLVAEDRPALRRRAAELARWRNGDDDPDAILAALPDSWIVGTPPEAAEQLAALEDAGVERVMLQHNLHWETETVELIGAELA